MTLHQPSQPVVAAVDVGSNSIKLTVARGLPNGQLEFLAADAEVVRLGTGVKATGRIADDRFAAGIETLKRFAELARNTGATRLVGVATEASRKAANGPEFLAAARAIGWDIQVISGDAEAAITFRGLAYDLDLSGWVVAADIGGASTEIIIAHDATVSFAKSFALGSGTLTEEHVPGDPPAATELETCRQITRETVAEAPVPEDRDTRLVVIGGTGEYLAALVPDSAHISAADIDDALAICRGDTSDELAARIGIVQARARVLPAGIAAVRGLHDRFHPAHVSTAHGGVRIGLLLQTIDEMSGGGAG